MERYFQQATAEPGPVGGYLIHLSSPGGSPWPRRLPPEVPQQTRKLRLAFIFSPALA
jgi:hypothetical protein